MRWKGYDTFSRCDKPTSVTDGLKQHYYILRFGIQLRGNNVNSDQKRVITISVVSDASAHEMFMMAFSVICHKYKKTQPCTCARQQMIVCTDARDCSRPC